MYDAEIHAGKTHAKENLPCEPPISSPPDRPKRSWSESCPIRHLRGAKSLVKVAAAALNPVDTYIRSGAIAMDLPMPFVVGCDLAGTVEAVGPDARQYRVGRPRVGHQPRAAGPPRHVCRTGRRRRVLALPNARRSRRRDGGGDFTGRDHGPPGTISRRPTRGRRDAVRQWRQRRRRLDRCADGQGDRRPRRHHGRNCAEKVDICRATGSRRSSFNTRTDDVEARVRDASGRRQRMVGNASRTRTSIGRSGCSPSGDG